MANYLLRGAVRTFALILNLNHPFAALQPNESYKYDPHLFKITRETVQNWFHNANSNNS